MNPFVAVALAVAAVTLATPATARKPAAPLNDTGLRRCLVDGALQTACEGTGQDAESGRDVMHPRSSNGVAGFSFVKIDAAGAPLPPDAADWSCVFDRVTGLLWEKKTDDGGPHDGSTLYTLWGDGLAGDAILLVRETNAERLCGHDDWRLPGRDELLGLYHFDLPSDVPPIDRRWFPFTIGGYWSGTIDLEDESRAWEVGFWLGERGGSIVEQVNRSGHVRLQLVRGGPPPADASRSRYLPRGQEVLDTRTGLVWRRCLEGQAWDGRGCTGDGKEMTWNDALARARAVAEATGTAWRLPNAKEAASMIDETRIFPALDPVFSYNPRNGSVWSSTIEALAAHDAYQVDDWWGALYSSWTAFEHNVRLVRDSR